MGVLIVKRFTVTGKIVDLIMDNEAGVEGNLPQGSENLLNQQQVNDIVKREKLQAAERVRREMDAQHQAELEKVRAEAGRGIPQQAEGQQVDADAIKQQVYNQFLTDLEMQRKKLAEEEETRKLQSLADQYHLKMGKGSQLFDDFNDVMGDFKPAEFSNTVMLVSQMENTPEIMRELVANPEKLAQIEGLAERSPGMAMKMLTRLSESVNANLSAKQNNVSAPPPLSQIKSSQVGTDSGKMTLKDFKNASWLRG